MGIKMLGRGQKRVVGRADPVQQERKGVKMYTGDPRR